MCEVWLAVSPSVLTVRCCYVDIVPFSRNRVSIISEAWDNLKSYVALFDSCYVVCMSFFLGVFRRYVFGYVSGCRARPLTAEPLIAWKRVGLVIANLESDIALECLSAVRSPKWHWQYARSLRSNSPPSAVMSS
jgi:hypothetical protein